MRELFILTGPSGAGLSTSKYVFEELGYYIVENAPYQLTKDLLDVYITSHQNNKGLVLIPNIMYTQKILDCAKKDKRYKTTFILLDASKEAILERYTLTRHDHPRATIQKITLQKAVELDAQQAELLSSEADIHIDTTKLKAPQLRKELYNRLENKEHHSTKITFLSFGLKNGIPAGIDNVIDVRVLPNPYWVENLAHLTGKDQEVIDYINSFPITKEFLHRLVEYLGFVLEEVDKKERPSYTIGIACSGGQHRSTYVAEYLKDYFKEKYDVSVIHRDMPDLNK